MTIANAVRTAAKGCASVVLLALLSGCVTPVAKLCPTPGEFTASVQGPPAFGGAGWLSCKASKVVENGQVKAIVCEEFWYAHRYGHYTIELSAGSREVGFRRRVVLGNMVDGFCLSYWTPENVHELEEWLLLGRTGGGCLVPVLAKPRYVLTREWQQQADGVWKLVFSYNPGLFGLWKKVKCAVESSD